MRNIFLLILLLLLSINSYCEPPSTVNKNEAANKPNDVKTTETANIEPENLIKVIPSECGNIKISEQKSRYDLILEQSIKAKNWFCATFDNLPTDEPVTMKMINNDMSEQILRWWTGEHKGLQVVVTYADPDKYDSYVTYHKNDDGVWVSDDPFLKENEKQAGKGKTPIQKAIQEKLAEKFLSEDGKYWQPWVNIDDTTARKSKVVDWFTMKYKFDDKKATIAFRIPFTTGYLNEYLSHLETAKLPGVNIDKVRDTDGKQTLQCIRLEDTDFDPLYIKDTHRTVLFYARENNNDSSSSFSAIAILNMLISNSEESKSMRKGKTWLIIPMLDPDGVVAVDNNRRTNMYENLSVSTTPVEAFGWGRYISDYYYNGRTIDLTVALTSENLPFDNNINIKRAAIVDRKQLLEINNMMYEFAKKKGYTMDANEAKITDNYACKAATFSNFCDSKFYVPYIYCEIGDRHSEHELNMAKVRDISENLLIITNKWLDNEEYSGKIHKAQLKILEQANKAKERWCKQYECNPYELSDMITFFIY